MTRPTDSDFERRLTQAARTIETTLVPAAIVLFGSRASGEEGRFSDVDLAVLVGNRAPGAITHVVGAGRHMGVGLLVRAGW